MLFLNNNPPSPLRVKSTLEENPSFLLSRIRLFYKQLYMLINSIFLDEFNLQESIQFNATQLRINTK